MQPAVLSVINLRDQYKSTSINNFSLDLHRRTPLTPIIQTNFSGEIIQLSHSSCVICVICRENIHVRVLNQSPKRNHPMSLLDYIDEPQRNPKPSKFITVLSLFMNCRIKSIINQTTQNIRLRLNRVRLPSKCV